MYFPLLFNKPSELRACEEFFSAAQFGCGPVVTVKSVAKQNAAQLNRNRNTTLRWAELSRNSVCVTFDVGPQEAAFVGQIPMPPTARLRLGADISQIASIQQVAMQFHAMYGHGVLLRVDSRQINSASAKRIAMLDARIPVWVLVSLPDLNGTDPNVISPFCRNVLDDLYNAGITKVILNGGSYPIDNAGMMQSNVSRVPRVEATLFRILKQSYSLLHFSDFGPHNRTPSVNVPNKTVTPAIRYAIADAWMVHRSAQGPKAGQVIKDKLAALSSNIVGATYYSGPNFSWADQQLEQYSNGLADPAGAVGTARAIDVNHHLAFVSDEVGSLAGSPTLPAVQTGAVL